MTMESAPHPSELTNESTALLSINDGTVKTDDAPAPALPVYASIRSLCAGCSAGVWCYRCGC